MRRFGRGEDIYGLYTAPIMDSADGYIPKANRFVTMVASLKSTASVNTNTGYYNGGAKVTRTTEGATVITTEGRGLPPMLVAMLLGKIYNEATGMLYDDGSQSDAPYCAVSFHRVYETGVKFEQYLKGKWSIEGEESATRKEDIDPKNINLIYTAISTEYQWDISQSGGCTYSFDDDAFVTLPNGSKRYQKVITKSVTKEEFESDPTSWYDHVQVPAPATIPALTLASSTPANNATNVAVNASITFELANGLSIARVIVLDENNSPVEGTVILSADGKSLTFVPKDDYNPAEVYIAAYECVDTYGQKLQGAIKITTT